MNAFGNSEVKKEMYHQDYSIELDINFLVWKKNGLKFSRNNFDVYVIKRTLKSENIKFSVQKISV